MEQGQHTADGEAGLGRRLIMGQYRPVRLLAKGGMAEVYLAEQPSLGRHAAIKILARGSDMDEERLARFRQEARVVSQLVHPNIITIYNFGELPGGLLFIAMEYVDGPSVAELLRGGPLPAAAALEVALQTAQALHHAHRRGVVHRDLKPDNVMLTTVASRVHVKVLDFGIARLADSDTLTQTGGLLGTPRYMSPEQCRGERAGPASDQYALGLLLYEMLTGKGVVQGTTVIQCLYLQQHVTPPPPSAVVSELRDQGVDAVVMRMLAKETENRYASTEAVCDALARLVQANPGGDAAIVGRARDGLQGGEGPLGQTLQGLPPAPAPEELGDTLLQGPPQITQSAPSVDLPLATAPPSTTEAHTAPLRLRLLGPSAALDTKVPPVGMLLDQPDPLPVPEGPYDFDREGDLFLLAMPPVCLDLSWNDWVRAGLPTYSTLVCVDSGVEPGVVADLSAVVDHMAVGAMPLESAVAGLALALIADRDPFEQRDLCLEGGHTALSFVEHGEHADILQQVDRHLELHGVRRAVRQRVREIAGEMVVPNLQRRPATDATETLPPHSAAAPEPLQCAVGERHVTLVAPIPSGQLTPSQLFQQLLGQHPPSALASQEQAALLGLHIMWRACDHLLLVLCPGHDCLLTALVTRGAAKSPRGRSLTMLQLIQPQEVRLGARLHGTLVRYHGRIFVELEGDIDESCDLSLLMRQRQPVTVNMARVSGINSLGVRAWLDAHRAADPPPEMQVEHCSLGVLSQLNMVPALAATVTVSSLDAPYVCPSCNLELLALVQVDELEPKQAPKRSCPECGGPLRLDDLPEKLFAFLGNTHRLDPRAR